jgi:hypothetical protein
VLANALGETVGLGGTFVIALTLLLNSEKTGGPLVAAGLVVLAGTLIEGSVVGTAQWLVLRQALPGVRWRSWVLVTALGACVAWTLGMIPSTVMSLGGDTGAAAPEMSDIAIYGLATLMGFVLGPILGTPQWLVLRRHVRKAGWWILANAVAWAFGMAIVFIGTGFIPAEGGINLGVIAILILFVVAAGVVVGAIHGLVLIWLVRLRWRQV